MLSSLSITITRSLRRSISIQVFPDGSLHVKAPIGMSSQAINTFLDEKRDWVQKQRKKIRIRPTAINREYKNGEQFMFLGNSVILTLGPYKDIRIHEDRLCFPDFLQFRMETELKRWFITQARQIISERVNNNAHSMNLSYKSLSFSDTKSKWGSCTHDNHLQFCWRLVMAPLLVIHYVVIHELVHTIEKNHSNSFWRKVSMYNPSYKQQIKWLKTYGDILIL